MKQVASYSYLAKKLLVTNSTRIALAILAICFCSCKHNLCINETLANLQDIPDVTTQCLHALTDNRLGN